MKYEQILLRANFPGTDLSSHQSDLPVPCFTPGFFRLSGLRKRFGRSCRYFARVVSSISLTFRYLLKRPGLFSFKRSVK